MSFGALMPSALSISCLLGALVHGEHLGLREIVTPRLGEFLRASLFYSPRTYSTRQNALDARRLLKCADFRA
jgi:hypothetical protein